MYVTEIANDLRSSLLLTSPGYLFLREDLREGVPRGVPPRPPDRGVRALPAGVLQVQLGRQQQVRAVQGQLEEGLGDRGMHPKGELEVWYQGDLWDLERDARLQAVSPELQFLPRKLGGGLLELPRQSLAAHLQLRG